MVSATPDNANPIVHTSTARRTRKRADSLDLSDDEEWARLGRGHDDDDDEGAADDEQLEEIDGEEIFGQSATTSRSPVFALAAHHGSWAIPRNMQLLSLACCDYSQASDPGLEVERRGAEPSARLRWSPARRATTRTMLTCLPSSNRPPPLHLGP